MDFLWIAQDVGMYVNPILTYLPKHGGYYPSVSYASIESWNLFYLTSEFVDAKERYLAEFIEGINVRGAPVNVVLGYDIENEMYYQETAKPLSLTSGFVTTTNDALTYDMADPAQRQQLMDSNLVQWINKIRAAGRAVDPTALIGVGFFSPKVAEGPDPRVTRAYWAIADADIGGSTADFVDLHVYAGWAGSMAEHLNSFQIPATHQKPLLMAEFGAVRSAYANATTAASAVKDLQVTSCQSGYDFVGWLFWTWDTSEQPEYYSATEAGGAINNVLAPVSQPNACMP